MLIHRVPSPPLRPFVTSLWATTDARVERSAREHVLPTGGMHLVFRTGGAPLRLFDGPDDRVGRTVGHAILGGARSAYYVRDVSEPASTVGAHFPPGAAQRLLGIDADEFAERHTSLEDLWGRAAVETREHLAEALSPDEQLDRFEAFLLARLPRVRGMHPAVAEALARFAHTSDVGSVVRASGYSHRRFIELFRRSVGLTPKLYCRVDRFQAALTRAASKRIRSWGELAHAVGYSDQAHFNREFRAFAGVSPGRYRELAPEWSHHVPVA